MSERHYLGYLDGLRALAAIIVLLGHSANAAGWGTSVIANLPGLAVDIFMTLSGYLMVYQAVQRKAQDDFGGFTQSFYLRRFFRIAPLFYLGLVLCYFSRGTFFVMAQTIQSQLPTLFISNCLICLGRLNFSSEHLLGHLSFLFGFSPSMNASTMMPDWTLTLEAQFYFIFPLLYLVFYRFPPWIGVLLLIAACSFLSHFIYPYFPAYPSVLPLRMNRFLAGMMIAWARWENPNFRFIAVALAFFCVLEKYYGEILLIILACDHGDSKQVTGLKPVADAFRFVLGSRLARFFADISYGIYLIHPCFVVTMLYFLCQWPRFLAFGSSQRFLILVIPVFILSTVLALALHYLVEKPGIKLGQRLTQLNAARRKGRHAKVIEAK